MNTADIKNWLGDNWSPEQTDELVALIEESGSDSEADWTRITLDYDGATKDAAYYGAIIDSARNDWAVESTEADNAWAVLLRAATEAVRGGMSEAAAAERAGISRTTLRAHLGK